MRKGFGIALGLLAITLATQSIAQPIHFWSHSFGNTSEDLGNAVAVDAAGNVFLTGTFNGTVDFGGGNLTSVGTDDIFLAKYNSRGVHQWSKRYGSTNSFADHGAIAVDGSGNVLLAGFFQGTANFGGFSLVSAGLEDIYVAKFSTNGVHQWSMRFGSTGSDKAYGIAVDGSDNVIVIGSFRNTVSFGGANLASAGLEDIFLAKYAPNGVFQWSQRFGSASSDNGYSVAVDVSGNVIATGSFQGTVNFGGTGLASSGIEDVFLAKYNSGGVHQWSQRFGSTGFDAGTFVATDKSSNVVLTGEFDNTVSFGGGGVVSAGDRDIFVAKYNPSGVHQWSKGFGAVSIDLGAPLAIDASGNVVISGSASGAVDLGGGSLPVQTAHDIFIAKYSPSGVHQWSRMFSGSGDDYAMGLASDDEGTIVATGVFGGESNFGGDSFVSEGNFDIFLARFGVTAAEPQIESIVDIGNDQGRQVKIRFAKSGFDNEAAPSSIRVYEAYRRDDAAPMTTERRPYLSKRQLMAAGWTQVGTVAAHDEDSYGIDVPTIGDSTIALGQYYSAFYIRAASDDPSGFFDSPIDSGYSVDNLAPAVPANLVYTAGVLSWSQSLAADYNYFSVYGSNTGSFASATLVDYTVTPTMNVSASSYIYYFVTATDFSGNEGRAAVINTLSGVGTTPKRYVLSLSAYPNPFNPSTVMRYTVPSHGRVTISIYDLRGALVTTLVDQEVDAGAYSVAWNGHDAHGSAVGSGVYFGRMAFPTGTRSYKLTLMK